MASEIEFCKVTVLTEDEAAQCDGLFDDNGGETDGAEYICADGEAPEGLGKTKSGYRVTEYTGAYVGIGSREFCGWSSRGVAYTTDKDTAFAIRAEEEIQANN